MGPESISLWLVILWALATIDSIVGGKYILTKGQFLRRLVPSIAILIIAIIAKNNEEVASYIYGNLYYVMLIATVVVIAFALYDITRIVVKGEELNYRRQRRRCGSRRTTPARH